MLSIRENNIYVNDIIKIDINQSYILLRLKGLNMKITK